MILLLLLWYFPHFHIDTVYFLVVKGQAFLQVLKHLLILLLVIIKHVIKYDPNHCHNVIFHRNVKMLVRILCQHEMCKILNHMNLSHKYSQLKVKKNTFNKPLLELQA